MSKVLKAVHEVVTTGDMPAKFLASTIGKPYATLMREVNTFDRGAKLGMETFMDIIRATGDTRPLELMVEELGHGLLPRK